jgi:plasmid stabilization system protein ParE
VTDPYRLIIAPKAAADLAGIHDDIAKDSPQNAALMATQIMDALELLQDVPHRTVLTEQPWGSKYPVRSVVVWPYIVYFRAIDDEKVVRVLRIRHGARRPLRRFD